MKNILEMAIFSRRRLTDSVAWEQITALSEFRNGLMRPDKCSELDPVRTPFDPANISEFVKWLDKPHGEFFYRKGRPVRVGGQMWNRTHSPHARFPSPHFANYWTGQFDFKWACKVGMNAVIDFVSEMFRVTHADFAFLTTDEDLNAKNRPPNHHSCIGLDMDVGIPGLYWTNLFSNEYGRWLGVHNLPLELVMSEKLPGGSAMLKFSESASDCRSLDVLNRQRATIDWLGRERFFDLRVPERKMETPDWKTMALPE